MDFGKKIYLLRGFKMVENETQEKKLNDLQKVAAYISGCNHFEDDLFRCKREKYLPYYNDIYEGLLEKIKVVIYIANGVWHIDLNEAQALSVIYYLDFKEGGDYETWFRFKNLA
jgi:hypothetical protein